VKHARALCVIVCAVFGPAIELTAQQPDRAESNANAVFPFPVHRTQLANGLTVISVEYDSPGIIAYYTVVRTGSRNEVEPGLSGFAHFFEHMMFRGTPRFSQEKYNDMLKGLGADSNAFTTDDWTCYHITASKDALETIVELESDRFQNLKYTEADFQKEARAVLGEYNKSASSPMLLLDEKMQDTAFTTHTYKHTTIGFLKDIVDMPNQYQYSLKFFDRWYRPANCIVMVVGDVEHEQLVGLAKKHYGGWKAGSARVDIPKEPPQTNEKTLELKWKGQTLPYLYISYHVPGFDAKSRDMAALDVLAEAAFSDTSPLYRKLVLDERKAESIQAGASFHRDPTLFGILVRLTSEEHIEPVRDAVFGAIAEFAKKPIEESRLNDIKSHMRYAFAMKLDTPDAVAGTLGEFLQLTANPDSVNRLYETYDLTTTDDINRVAQKYFVPTNRTVIRLEQEKTAARQNPQNTQSSLARFDARDSSPDDFPNSFGQETQPCSMGGVAHDDDLIIKSNAKSSNDMILPNPKSPLVAIRLLFNVGTKDDPVGKEGLAALTARMLSEGGTKRYSYDQILERLYPMAAKLGASCDKEVTVFSGNVHRDKLSDFYGLFSEMLAAPRFDAQDFERLRDEQLNFVSKTLRGNSDESLGKWTLQLMLYPKHPYGHVDAGTVSGLKTIALEDVKEFYLRYFAPISARVQLGVAGGADESFVNQFRKDFRSSPARSVASRELPRPHSPKDLELTIVKKDCIASAISIGFPLSITRADNDFYALAVANSALGEHRTFNGRLMQNMRGKRGLNYGDYSYIENFMQDGMSTFPIPNTPRAQQYFSIWIRPVPHDKAIFALRQAIRELDMIVEKGLSDEEFETTRRFLLNYSKLWVQSQSRRLGYEMDGNFFGRSSLVAELDRRLRTLTREQVNAAVKKHLQAKNLSIVIVTRDAETIRDELLAGISSPLHYDTEGTPQEILDEDKLIETYPLRFNADRVRTIPIERMFE